MKIQLLQDIEDSGAAPPARRPPASAWHRAPATPAGGRGARVRDPMRDRGQGPVQERTTEQPPMPAAPPHTAPPTGSPSPAPSPAPSTTQASAQARTEGETTAAPITAATPKPYFASEPDWLVELMRQDADRADAQQRAGQWRRRVCTWTVAAGVLATLAAGGFWLVEDRRIDGALVVVAETTPPAASAPAAPAPGTPAISAKTTPEKGAPSAAAPAAPSLTTGDAIAPGVARVPASPMFTRPPLEVASPVATADAAADAARPAPQPAVPGRERKANPGRAEAKQVADRESSERHRREETLLQCRALGYDEAQCVKRGCVMTRFGLACRG